MRNIKIAIVVLLFISCKLLSGQNKTLDTTKKKIINLDEIVISANKFEESKKKVAQQVQVLTSKEISSSQSQSSADLISNTAGVFVQKSQLGGGSPIIRGFEASRILLVIDGVRMNNIIYRAGHLQNVVTIDNSILDRVEILYGPSSTIYGSDALGGVIHFYSKNPLLAVDDNKLNIKVNAFSRYSSINNEITNHLDFNVGSNKFASLSSITYSIFDDLKGGKNQNPFYTTSYGERPYFVERFNGKDSLVKNSNRYLQKQSGYTQYDLLQKFLFKQNEHLTHILNIQYSNSSNVPRYDRLTDPSGGGLKYADWYYGPQSRLFTAYDLNFKNTEAVFQSIHFGVNFQNIEESRHNRKFNSSKLAHNIENVNVIGTNLDFQKVFNSNTICFGFDGQFNTLKSTANTENIVTNVSTPLNTRYPDGDNTLMNMALFVSHSWQINEQLILNDGLRAGFVSLHSTFVDTSFFRLPYSKADQNTPVYSVSLGLVNNLDDDWKLSLLTSTGFRVPNVDDLSKVFESAPGVLIVPNSNLKPEKTINTELSIAKVINQKTQWENTVYYTHFYDAIVCDKFNFNGKDSIMYDGTMSNVYANQNKEEAYLYGFSSSIKSQFNDNFLFTLMMNYTYGRIKTDSADYPLDHIPPFVARMQLKYTNNNFSSDFFVNYNGWKKIKDYNLGGEDNVQYATAEGMPAWYTVNLRASYKLHKLFTVQIGVDNIFDTQYRVFASGINSPGRNIYGTLKFHF